MICDSCLVLSTRYGVYQVPDSLYGAKLENGEWTGTTEQLILKVCINIISTSWHIIPVTSPHDEFHSRR